MPSAEIYSWCPFAGRSNDPEYAECYNANEEHTPRVFTVQGLCQHVFTQHTDKYKEFTRNIRHHIESNRCNINGVRIIAGTATPLDTAHIQSELNAFEEMEHPDYGGTVAQATEQTPAQNKVIKPPTKEDIDLAFDDLRLVDHIEGVLANTPIWAGTMQDLLLKLSTTLSRTQSSAVLQPPTGCTFMKTARNLGKSLTRIKHILDGDDIRFFMPPYNEFNASVMILQKKEDGKFRSINELREVIKAQIAGTRTEPADAETATETETEDELLINSIRGMLGVTQTLAGTLEDVYLAILESVISAVGHSESTFLKDRYALRSRIVRIQNRLWQYHTRVFEVPDTWFQERIMVFQRAINGEFEPVSRGSVAKLLAQKQGTDAIITSEDNYFIGCIRRVLEVTPTWAGTPEDLYTAIRHAALNISDHGDKFTFIETPHDLGKGLSRIKPRLERNHIRIFKAPYADFNKQVLVLQREVNGKFEPVSRGSVTKLLTRTQETDTITAHEDKLLVNRIQEVLGDASLWAGSMYGLHAELSSTLSSESLLPPVECAFMQTPRKLSHRIIRIKPILNSADIRFTMPPHTEFNAPVVILQRKEDGKFRPMNELHEAVRAHIMGTGSTEVVCTDPHALPRTMQTSLEEDFERGVPTEEIRRRIIDQTGGTFRITEHRMKKYLELWDIARPPTTLTCTWSSDAAEYIDWGEHIIERIQNLVDEWTQWKGTVTDLHAIIKCTVGDIIVPAAPDTVERALHSIKDRLEIHDIYIEIVVGKNYAKVIKIRKGEPWAINPYINTYHPKKSLSEPVIKRVKQLLESTPMITGSPTEVFSIIRHEIDGKQVPASVSTMGWILNRSEETLFNEDIKFSRFAIHPSGNIQLLVLQKKIDGVFKSDTELYDSLIMHNPDDEETASNGVCTDPHELSETASNGVCTNTHELSETMQKTIAGDLKGGIPITAVRHRISDQTGGKFQISEYKLKQYAEQHNIERPQETLPVIWDSVIHCYLDWSGCISKSIQQLLENTPEWTGTAAELHPLIKCGGRGTITIPPNGLSRALDSIAKRLTEQGIQYTKHGNPYQIQLQRISDIRQSGTVINTDPEQQIIDAATPEPIPTTTDELPEITDPTTDELPEIIDPTTERSIEVIGVTTIEQSRIGIPDDVLNRIGVKEGGRIIYLDDGENIIIKPAKYTA